MLGPTCDAAALTPIDCDVYRLELQVQHDSMVMLWRLLNRRDNCSLFIILFSLALYIWQGRLQTLLLFCSGT